MKTSASLPKKAGLLPAFFWVKAHPTNPSRIAITRISPRTKPSRTAFPINNKMDFSLLDMSPPRGYIVSNNGWQDGRLTNRAPV